jgi:hypothetical protein
MARGMSITPMGSSQSRLRGCRVGLLAVLGAVLIILIAPSAIPEPIASRTTVPIATAAAKEPPCEVNLKLPSPICHVFIVFLENQEESWVLNNTSFEGKYLTSHYAFASQYYSVIHYSFPNYLAATAGFATNYQHLMSRNNVVNLIQNKSGLTWDAYMQGMPHPCDQNYSLNYRAAHNPLVYYADIFDRKAYCWNHDQTFVPWQNAVANGSKLPNYALFAPNVTNDCWKFGLQLCDTWLHGWLSPLINDSAVFSNSVFFITYDEGASWDNESSNGTAVGGGHVYTVAVSPFACKGYISQTHYNTYSMLTTTEWLLGLGKLGYQDNWTVNPPMSDLFCFPNGTTNFSVDRGVGASLGHGDLSFHPTGSPPLVAAVRPKDGLLP